MMDDKLSEQHDEDTTFAKEALICTIGSKLEKAREAKSLSKAQVLQELKFNDSFLDALENGEWSKMPGEIYALGFLRQYAELLGLDLTKDIERIKTSSYELTTPLTYPDAAISPNRTWAAIAAILFIIVLIVSNLFVSDDDDIKPNTLTKDGTEPVLPSNKQDINPTIANYPNPSNNILKDTNIPIESSKPVLEAVIQKQNRPTSYSYSFEAVSDDVWLQIYEQTGSNEPVLKREALLRLGQGFNINSSETILITSGKPTALKVLKNKNVMYKVGSLGEEGKVLKLFPLE